MRHVIVAIQNVIKILNDVKIINRNNYGAHIPNYDNVYHYFLSYDSC